MTVQRSCSVLSDSLQPHGLQNARLSYPSPTPRACSNSGPSSWWCHPTISSSVIPFSLCLPFFPTIRVFSNESVLHIRWPKYWSFNFSISPSNEYLALISFRTNWFDLLAVLGTLKSLLQHHSSKASNGTYKDQILGHFTSFLPCPKPLALFLRYHQSKKSLSSSWDSKKLGLPITCCSHVPLF